MFPVVDSVIYLGLLSGILTGDPTVIVPTEIAPISAAVAPTITTVTNTAEQDVDFPFQGEYWGESTPEALPQHYGLQVTAQGEGKFEALLHEGGLPGKGASGHAGFRLKGERSTSSFLRMEGGGWVSEITDGKSATLTSLAGGLTIALFSKTERISPTMGAKPPANAIILFDGSTLAHLINAETTDDGLLKVGAETAMPYRDFVLHAEFRTPYMPLARSQKRGNSGFYLQRRYEVQVLDTFGQWPQHNEGGSLYRLKPPDVNLCLPPLVWQTYDIDFTAARFDHLGTKISPAVITVKHNGVTIHDHYAIPRKTGGGKQEGPEPLPILFQNHGDPVHYRNIWLVVKN